MVDEASRALFFHAAPDSEELCEEALRCHPGPVSTHIYHGALQQPEEHFLGVLSGNILGGGGGRGGWEPYLRSPRSTRLGSAEGARGGES